MNPTPGSITIGFGSGTRRIVARFESGAEANDAQAAVSALLDSARDEVDHLLAEGNGAAEMTDVEGIYSRYGLTNRSGWVQELPLVVHGRELLWDAPDGLDPSEAEIILWALGAVDVSVTGASYGEEPWREMAHPFAAPPGDVDEFLVERETDDPPPRPRSKKLLH